MAWLKMDPADSIPVLIDTHWRWLLLRACIFCWTCFSEAICRYVLSCPYFSQSLHRGILPFPWDHTQWRLPPITEIVDRFHGCHGFSKYSAFSHSLLWAKLKVCTELWLGLSLEIIGFAYVCQVFFCMFIWLQTEEETWCTSHRVWRPSNIVYHRALVTHNLVFFIALLKTDRKVNFLYAGNTKTKIESTGIP